MTPAAAIPSGSFRSLGLGGKKRSGKSVAGLRQGCGKREAGKASGKLRERGGEVSGKLQDSVKAC